MPFIGSATRQRKREAQEVRNVVAKKNGDVLTARSAEMCTRSGKFRLLHVDEEVTLENVLSFLVLL